MRILNQDAPHQRNRASNSTSDLNSNLSSSFLSQSQDQCKSNSSSNSAKCDQTELSFPSSLSSTSEESKRNSMASEMRQKKCPKTDLSFHSQSALKHNGIQNSPMMKDKTDVGRVGVGKCHIKQKLLPSERVKARQEMSLTNTNSLQMNVQSIPQNPYSFTPPVMSNLNGLSVVQNLINQLNQSISSVCNLPNSSSPFVPPIHPLYSVAINSINYTQPTRCPYCTNSNNCNHILVDSEEQRPNSNRASVGNNRIETNSEQSPSNRTNTIEKSNEEQNVK